MRHKIREIARLLRPRQWIKNFAVFAAILFSGSLFDIDAFLPVFFGALIFCGISSGVYIINDIFDIEKDRLHPFKRFRPIANGSISIQAALVITFLLISISLYYSFLLSSGFFISTLIYLALQLSYSLVLKHIAVLDILALAGGYILRVYAGEFITTNYHISVWLLLTTISLSLFLAVGKRRRELTLVSSHTGVQIAAVRKTLSHYSERLLDVYASIFATSTFISYALFTFLENSKNLTVTNDLLLASYLPAYLQRKWLMLTILPVVYGLMRYLQDIYEKHQGESPEKVLFSDRPLLATVIIWVILVIVIVYLLGGTRGV